MNVLDSSAIYHCTSCQMCAAVCPKTAISISLNKDGFYRPYIEESLCIDCGLCVKVCVKFDNRIIENSENDLNRTKLIAASVKDNDIIRKTTSGGLSDILAKQLIKEGYWVIGVAYDTKTNRAIHQSASSELSTDAFRGSKYIQSYSVNAFRELVNNCHHQKYAIIGLPCQIYAIGKYLNRIKRRENCILIDLYCHGCPSMHVWTKVSDNIRHKLNCDNFCDVNWRSKKRGWGTFVLSVNGDNGKNYVSRPLHNEFFDLFFSNQVLNESCTACKLRSTLAYTDIRLGDFWGKEYNKTFRGMSAVSIVTKSGERLFDKIKDRLYVNEKKYSTFLPYQSWSHVYKIDETLRMELLLKLQNKEFSLKQCMTLLTKRKSFRSIVMVFMKQILSYMPVQVEYKLRFFLKK